MHHVVTTLFGMDFVTCELEVQGYGFRALGLARVTGFESEFYTGVAKALAGYNVFAIPLD